MKEVAAMTCENGISLCEGAALGAATMYFLDPQQGRQRRAACMGEVNRLLHGDRPEAGREGAATAKRLQGPGNNRQRPEATDAGGPNLTPETRLLFGALGAGLFAWGLTQRAPTACLLGSLGVAFAWPAAVGHGPGRRESTIEQGSSSAAERRMMDRPNTETTARRRECEPIV